MYVLGSCLRWPHTTTTGGVLEIRRDNNNNNNNNNNKQQQQATTSNNKQQQQAATTRSKKFENLHSFGTLFLSMSGSDTSAPNGTVREESFRTGAERGELQEAEAVAIILTLYRRHSNNQKSQLPSKRKAKRVLEEQLPHFRVNGSTLGKLVAKAQNLLEGERCLERQNKLAEKKRLIECRRRVESQLAHGAASDSEGGSAQCLRAISLAGDTSLRCCDETSGQMVTSSAVHGGSPTSSTHGIAFLHFDPEKYPEILQRRSSTLISRFRNLRVGFHSSSHSATSEATGRCVMDESTEVRGLLSDWPENLYTSCKKDNFDRPMKHFYALTASFVRW